MKEVGMKITFAENEATFTIAKGIIKFYLSKDECLKLANDINNAYKEEPNKKQWFS